MTYYDTLELSENASIDVIKMAYKALVKKYHPDTYEGSIEDANRHMAEINEAYEILSDPIKKAEYDGFLNGVRASAMYAEGFKENASSSSETQSKSDIKPLVKARFDKTMIMVISGIVILLLLILFLDILPSAADKNYAIELVKEQYPAEEWAKDEPNIKEAYGWEARKVEPNLYYVEYAFDLDNAIKSDGYSLYCFEVNIISGKAVNIIGSPTLEQKYAELGYIDE